MLNKVMLRGPALIAALVAALGFVASIAQLVTLGTFGILTVVVVVLSVGVLVARLIGPSLRKNGRGERLLVSIAALGMQDLEMRGYGRNNLPEPQYLRTARRDVLIVGPTLYGVAERQADDLRQALDRGVAVRLLVLDPDWAASQNLVARVDVGAQIRDTLALLRREGLLGHRGLSVRFVGFFPSYRGVLVDGDVAHSGSRPDTARGWLRLQPHLSCDLSGHRAMVLEFAATAGAESPFDLFATDLRQLWGTAVERPDLVGPQPS
ncbi:hypothetical protein DQ237_14590 [Blastococcus sp. TF02-8]|uniref:hypothetical protein n=1 Tax=Blastococcus sp. TF02-8 TaxID=2250574 RepID=UPI000DE901BB|nr:hypothetical protein [Blastococcus sp. TF02-8]RBY95297.1 hypothetical protein DQ237_14590 [Blastococcus sp. TF02-8]